MSILDMICFLFAAPCQAAWAAQWAEAVFNNVPKAIRHMCSMSLFIRLRSLILTHTARPQPRTRNPIAVSQRLTVVLPQRREDNPPDQVEHPTSQRPRPQPVSFRHDQFAAFPTFRAFKVITLIVKKFVESNS